MKVHPAWYFAAYFVIMMLTTGYYTNHECLRRSDDSLRYEKDCNIDAFAAGLWWPYYWSRKLAVFLTK